MSKKKAQPKPRPNRTTLTKFAQFSRRLKLKKAAIVIDEDDLPPKQRFN